MALKCGRSLVRLALICFFLNIQHTQGVVKIDVSKTNQKATNETSTTTTTSPGTTASAENSSEPSLDGTTTVANQLDLTTGSSSTAVTTSTTVAQPKPTEAPETTTIPPVQLEPPKEGRLIKTVPQGYYCRCDLKINICDVNCCCDIDCNEAVLRTYDCDREQIEVGDYRHRDGLQSCEVQGGLFCLVGEKDGRDVPDKSHYNPNLKQKYSRHKWNEIFPTNENPKDISNRMFYKVNDLVQFYNESSEQVETFVLPYSITNSECQLKQPVRFLRDQSTQCLRSLESLDSFTESFVEQQSQMRYLRYPKNEIVEHCADSDCFNITVIRYCNLSGSKCRANNQTEWDGTWMCPEIRIQFVHNYTHLESVAVFILCGSIEELNLETDSIWHRFTVSFKREHEERFARSVSGNLGYLQQKPLLVSNLQIPVNDTVETRRSSKYMLSYFTNETRLPDETFRLKLPKSKGNRCTLDERNHHQVLFGENIWTKCNFYPKINVSADSNFTEVCNDLQSSIFELLLHGIQPQFQLNDFESLNIFLSKYGNPVNRTTDWIQLRSSNVVEDKIIGTRDPKRDLFTCYSVIINVRYQFYHARQTVRNVPRQQVLHEAEVIFGPRVDLQFPLNEEVRVPIFAQAQFFDLTSRGSNSATGVDIILALACVTKLVI
ncbi:tectonic [Uranotaenia lowii]|uniref:tectonic n=1 Tax=Uranotaenia lowii TaxID=190385 RepID=UPI002478E723|nr:tectonic [Uranotaenia lowii]